MSKDNKSSASDSPSHPHQLETVGGNENEPIELNERGEQYDADNDETTKKDIESMTTTTATANNKEGNESCKSNTDSLPDEPDQEEKTPSRACCCSRLGRWLCQVYWSNEFVILVILAISLARAYPPLGNTYLAPQITSTWIAVMFIFLMAGLGLKTKEFSNAFQQIYFNAFVQTFSFGVVSSIGYGLSKALVAANIIPQSLGDGMTICASLPMTINMVLVLTKASDGNEAAALFNAAFGNMVGVFLSPILILGYLGVTSNIDLASVFYQLAIRVVAPVIVGQLLQKFFKRVVAFVDKYNNPYFKQAQQYALVFIVYTVFCDTFASGSNTSVGDIFIMVAFQFILLAGVMVLSWYFLKLLFPRKPKLRVMGLFGCTHKTVAMGIPLINALYNTNPDIGLYTLPLLIWHPMQLLLGSFLSPYLAAFVQREQARLGIADDQNDSDATVPDETGDVDNNNKEGEDNIAVTMEEGRILSSSKNPDSEGGDSDGGKANEAEPNGGEVHAVAHETLHIGTF